MTRADRKLARVCVLSFALGVFLSASVMAQTAQSGAVKATTSPSRPKGSITGRVVGEDGQPLAGARVFAQGFGSRSDAGATALTNADGAFAIENIERGAYVVHAYAPDYFDASILEYERGRRTFHHLGASVHIRLVKGGVITGRVMNARGEPAAGVRVNMVRVRTSDGRPVRESGRFMRSLERGTDDRGIYRNYGLLPGVYLVSAGGRFAVAAYNVGPHGGEAPTFYPSATRDNAGEITLQASEEIGGIDIKLRGEEGRAISGTVEGVTTSTHADLITTLRLVSTGTTEHHGSSYFYGQGTSEAFMFDGLPDGDYVLVVERHAQQGWVGLASAKQRITVRGADVTGLRIKLVPFGTIAGRVRVEATTATPAPSPSPTDAQAPCGAPDPQAALDEAVLTLRRVRGASSVVTDQTFLELSPDEKGEFTFRSLSEGTYDLSVRLGGGFYLAGLRREGVGAATTTAAAAKPAAKEATRERFTLRQGESVSGLVLVVRHGAASLRGRIAVAESSTEGNNASAAVESVRAYLVPAERERADDALNYAATLVSAEGEFVFDNLAPGRYLFVTRPALSASVAPDAPEADVRAAFSDVSGRAALRREAEAANVSVQLSNCQRLEGFSPRKSQ